MLWFQWCLQTLFNCKRYKMLTSRSIQCCKMCFLGHHHNIWSFSSSWNTHSQMDKKVFPQTVHQNDYQLRILSSTGAQEDMELKGQKWVRLCPTLGKCLIFLRLKWRVLVYCFHSGNYLYNVRCQICNEILQVL